MDPECRKQRSWLKSDFAGADFQSDQQKGVACPDWEKPVDDNATVLELGELPGDVVEKNDLIAAISSRRSRRRFTDQPLSLAQLHWLLWATQGVKRVLGEGQVVFRTVPSAGARHPFETYLAVLNVEGVQSGIWRYRSSKGQLVHVRDVEDLGQSLGSVTLGQDFLSSAAVVFFWAAVPYRTEWRYDRVSHKAILLDAGHVAQNLYVAVEGIGCGTCAIAAYDQVAVDAMLGLDGDDEFVIYLAPVGRV
ncbi:MAG: SagB/ThcOx family dehydrogenase [Phycisphaerae bacterium]